METAITDAPVLALLDFSKAFHCGVWCFRNRSWSLAWRMHFSQLFNLKESSYSACTKEITFLVLAAQKWRIYLFGNLFWCEQIIHVESIYSPRGLQLMHKKKRKWLYKLSVYDFMMECGASGYISTFPTTGEASSWQFIMSCDVCQLHKVEQLTTATLLQMVKYWWFWESNVEFCAKTQVKQVQNLSGIRCAGREVQEQGNYCKLGIFVNFNSQLLLLIGHALPDLFNISIIWSWIRLLLPKKIYISDCCYLSHLCWTICWQVCWREIGGTKIYICITAEAENIRNPEIREYDFEYRRELKLEQCVCLYIYILIF